MPGVEITDARHSRVKAARRLLKRAFRQADRAFLAEGPQAVREAVSWAVGRGGGVRDIFATAEALSRYGEMVDEARALGIPVHRASGQVVAALSDTVTPQGIVAVCDLLDVALTDVLNDSAPSQPKLVALLAAVRDPGNAGTVIRTADAAGADAVVLTDASVDVYNGKCVRASAGSIFHLPVVVGVSAADATSALRGAGVSVLAAEGSAEMDLDSVEADALLAAPTAWLFGNEAWGLPADVLSLADQAIRVPIHGRAESLNLATAAAVCLYASARQQRRAKGQ
jgi:TrmH family RNA methyltransferase